MAGDQKSAKLRLICLLALGIRLITKITLQYLILFGATSHLFTFMYFRINGYLNSSEIKTAENFEYFLGENRKHVQPQK